MDNRRTTVHTPETFGWGHSLVLGDHDDGAAYAGHVPGESIELPSGVVASVRELVGPDGVQAFVVTAIEGLLKNRELGRILDQIEAEAGAVPPGLTAEAEAFWRAS